MRSEPPDRGSPRCGGLVLCGGQSSRMGRPKAWLPFGDELLLPRIIRILSDVVAPIVVVAAVDQPLPDLSSDVVIVRDEYDALGPLAGLATGFNALQGRCDAAYVSSTDVPLLSPAFVRYVIEALGDHDIAVPRDGRFYHPLAGCYRLTAEATARELLAAKQLRPLFLIERLRTREISLSELQQVDPQLGSLRNINLPEEYEAVLREAFPVL